MPQADVQRTKDRLQHLGELIYARDGELPVIERGSAEWNAWRAWRVENGLNVSFMNRQERWTVPLRWPPTDLESAIRETVKKSSFAEKLKTQKEHEHA